MTHKTWFYHNFLSSFLSRILRILFWGSNILEPSSNILEPLTDDLVSNYLESDYLESGDLESDDLDSGDIVNDDLESDDQLQVHLS